MPDGRTLAEVAREHSPKALKVLVDALDKPDLAFAAAKELLDRGFGRAPQSVEMSGPDGGAIKTETYLDTSGLSEKTLREIASLNADNA